MTRYCAPHSESTRQKPNNFCEKLELLIWKHKTKSSLGLTSEDMNVNVAKRREENCVGSCSKQLKI